MNLLKGEREPQRTHHNASFTQPFDHAQTLAAIRHIIFTFRPRDIFRSALSALFRHRFTFQNPHAVVRAAAVPPVATGRPGPTSHPPLHCTLCLIGVVIVHGAAAVHARILHQVELCRTLSTRQKISLQCGRHRLIAHQAARSTQARAWAAQGRG